MKYESQCKVYHNCIVLIVHTYTQFCFDFSRTHLPLNDSVSNSLERQRPNYYLEAKKNYKMKKICQRIFCIDAYAFFLIA